MVVISSTIKIMIILSGKGIIWFIFSFVLDYIIGTILYTVNYYRSSLSIFRWKFNKNIAKEFLSSSYLLIIAGMTGFLLMRIDQVMIKHFLDESAVGIYAAAVRIAEIWYFIPSIVIASVFPAIINSKETNQITYKNRVRKMYWFLFLSGLTISIVISLFSPLIIKMFFGHQYINSALILQIYTWSNIGLFLMLGINKFFISENKLGLIFIYSLLAVVLNIILNIIMIPTIGLSGAAWATFISYSVGPIIFLISRKYAK
jgi:O-antigen/teichoic acid export membrane protein